MTRSAGTQSQEAAAPTLLASCGALHAQAVEKATAAHAETIKKVPQAEEARRRILFLTVAMKGHAFPMMRLAKNFVARGDHEAHLWLGGSFKDLAPEGAVIHEDGAVAEMDKSARQLAEKMVRAQQAPDWHGSLVAMLSALGEEEIEDTAIYTHISGALEVINNVSPDIVVADMLYDMGDAVAGFCARRGTKFFVLACPARPEALLRPGVMLPVVLKNFGVVGRMLPNMARLSRRVLELTGPKAGPGELATRIFPGDRYTLQDAPGSREVCVGPFLPVPSQRKQSEAIRRADPELAAWLDASPDPVVLVSLGTLVLPEGGLLERLAQGLAAGLSADWRVLWSLPERQHVHLPAAIRAAVQAGRCRVAAFVPQAAVLRHENVRAFLSHCGQNSTHESLVCGVPLVCMPFFCDQYEWANAVCSHLCAGVLVDKYRSPPAAIAEAVAAVLTEGSPYRAGAEECADQLVEARRRADEELGGAIGEEGCSGVLLATALIVGEVSQDQVEKCQRPLSKPSRLWRWLW